MNLSDRVWKEFKIIDLFDVIGSKTTKLNVLKNSNQETKEYPYITTKSTNNGIDGFYKHKTEQGNVITFDSATIGYISYQQNDFSASDHVEILKLKSYELNYFIANFLITAINTALVGKFDYGFKLSQTRMKKQIILLPVRLDDETVPDYEFMETYTKALIQINKMKCLDYVKASIKEFHYVKVAKLDEKVWKEFSIIDIFPEIMRGKRLIKLNQIDGNTPYVSSTALNNGISNFISNSKNVRMYEKCITIANSGSVGSSFYHPYKFIASDHVTQLKNDKMDKFIYLFISSMSKRLSEKYNFNREINDKRIATEKILLPIGKNNHPDYKYMRQYIINLMISKYSKFIL